MSDAVLREALKPCPFCGGPAEMKPWHGGGPDKRIVKCADLDDDCVSRPMVTGETPAEAQAKWNTRAAPSPQPADVRQDFAPCPLCKQYSHSIGDDQLTAAFNHFQSMFSHRGDGLPTQFSFDEKTRDAAQVLMAAAAPQPTSVAPEDVVERVRDAITPELLRREEGRDTFEFADAVARVATSAPQAEPADVRESALAVCEHQGREAFHDGLHRYHNNPYHVVREARKHNAWTLGWDQEAALNQQAQPTSVVPVELREAPPELKAVREMNEAIIDALIAQWPGTKRTQDLAERYDRTGEHFYAAEVPTRPGWRTISTVQLVRSVITLLHQQAQPAPDEAETQLVAGFSAALLTKLRASEAKYGWNSAWQRPDWREELPVKLAQHVSKGDPIDVAIYAAFAWHHGWSTAPAAPPAPQLGDILTPSPELQADLDALRTASARSAAAPLPLIGDSEAQPVAGDMVMVPREPTEAMAQAALAEMSGPTDFDPKASAWDAVRAYRAMLTAAQQQEASNVDGK